MLWTLTRPPPLAPSRLRNGSRAAVPPRLEPEDGAAPLAADLFDDHVDPMLGEGVDDQLRSVVEIGDARRLDHHEGLAGDRFNSQARALERERQVVLASKYAVDFDAAPPIGLIIRRPGLLPAGHQPEHGDAGAGAYLVDPHLDAVLGKRLLDVPRGVLMLFRDGDRRHGRSQEREGGHPHGRPQQLWPVVEIQLILVVVGYGHRGTVSHGSRGRTTKGRAGARGAPLRLADHGAFPNIRRRRVQVV